MTKAKKILTEEEFAELQARGPTMPPQRRALKKKGEETEAAKGSIKIAKAEMTLTGFKHTATTMSRKQKLMTKDFDAKSAKSGMSSSRRSRRTPSHVSYEDDLHNPPSEDRSQSAAREGFHVLDPNEVPPLNEELDVESNDEIGLLSPQNDIRAP